MSKLLDKSIEIAKKLHSPHSQPFNIYAFIYDKNKLLSIGHNDMLNQSKKAYDLGNRFNVQQFKNWPYKHAELDAISRLWGRVRIGSRHTLVTVRLLKDFSVANARPCKDCMEVINGLGISKMEWTDNVR